MPRSRSLLFLFITIVVGLLPVTANTAQSGSGPWFGFSITCSNCSFASEGDGAFRFSEPPVIRSVEPGGPADRAGLAAGDVLLTIDGHPVTSVDGARPLTHSSPGDRLRVTFRRGASQRSTTIVAAAWPDAGLADALRGVGRALGQHRQTTPADAPVRFSGSFRDVGVLVRGTPTVSVLLPEGDCWMEIVSGDIRVRLEKPGGCPGR